MRNNSLKIVVLLAGTFFILKPAHAQFVHHHHARMRRGGYIQDYVSSRSAYPSPLDLREAILNEPISNDFTFEVTKLTSPPTMVFKAVEGQDYHQYPLVSIDAKARSAYESQVLTAAQQSTLATVKTALDANAAYEAAKDLPPVVRAYASGAVAFDDKNYQQAATRFIEAQAAGDAMPGYKVWATFMLGRSYAKLNMPDKAHASFALTRDLVAKGAPDPLGLASASYGEEARLALDKAGGVLGEETFNPNSPDRLQQFHEAIRLYTLQAQTGSQSGFNSLHILAKNIKNQPSDFTLLMQDEIARRLFLAYVRGYNSRSLELNYPRLKYNRRMKEGGVEAREEFIKSLLPLFPAQDKDVADQLAAAAVEVEDYSRASSYALQKYSALSMWVCAKLALRAGDIEKAAAYYDKALELQKKEKDNPSIDSDSELLKRERAILTLARGKYLDAFAEFSELSSQEAEYLADRVLTIDEFKNSVGTESAASSSTSSSREENEKIINARLKSNIMRSILAHRLMRLGKYHEALQYFPDFEKDAGEEYIKWLDKAQTATNKIDKAEALYQAAVVMRENGTGLLGQEVVDFQAPDDLLQGSPYMTQGERDRLAASRAEASWPPSYRRIATAEIEQAVDLVPQKSQAFAALLCEATHWMMPVDEDEAMNYYHRYAHQGALVPWATHFGHNCPTPDFDAAKHERLTHFYLWIKHLRHWHHRAVMAALICSLGLISGILIYRRRKHKSGQTTA